MASAKAVAAYLVKSLTLSVQVTKSSLATMILRTLNSRNFCTLLRLGIYSPITETLSLMTTSKLGNMDLLYARCMTHLSNVVHILLLILI